MAVISGVVLERYSNKPVAGAAVTIGSGTTYTDASGRFSMLPPEIGVVGISVSAGGYDGYSASMNTTFQGAVTIYMNPRFSFL